MDNHKLAIGQRLRTIRLKMGINQNVFARALNMVLAHEGLALPARLAAMRRPASSPAAPMPVSRSPERL